MNSALKPPASNRLHVEHLMIPILETYLEIEFNEQDRKTKNSLLEMGWHLGRCVSEQCVLEQDEAE